MRLLSTLTCLALLLTSTGSNVGAAPKSGGSGGYDQERRPRAAPISLTSSVVIRQNPDVAAASDDPAAYAADRSIVFFRSDVADPVAAADDLGNRFGFQATHIFQQRFKGFAAKISADVLAAVDADPRVVKVTPDAVMPYSVAPTGVRRIGTQLNTTARLDDVDGSGHRVNADVAVLDSGVDITHPDLNVTGGADCTGLDDPYFDQAGHGTHIAGTIGALDDGVGVVGVAPGARLWSIKVGDAFGSFISWYLCGLTVLADNTSLLEVVNISLGTTGSDGVCSSSEEHQLICDAVGGGVTVVVAAGNDGANAGSFVPATFSEVITVSAFADTDGLIGGKGPNSHAGADDTFADFSNYGSDVDLAAPGVDILSTWPTAFSSSVAFGLEVLSGTSMAAPHVAGAAALYIAKNGRVGPAAVKSGLRANSDTKALVGDPDSNREPVLYVGAIAPSCSLSPTSGKVNGTITVSCTKFRANEVINVYLDSTSNDRLMGIVASSAGSGSKEFKIPTLVRGGHSVISRGATSGKQTTDTFSVVPSLALSPKFGPSGTTVRVSLRGFAKGETITLKWYTTASSTQTLLTGQVATSVGSKSLTFVVPAGTVGLHKVEATGSRGNKASANFSLRAASVSAAEEPPTEIPAATATSTTEPTATPSTEPTDDPEPIRTPRPTRTARPTRTPVPTGTPASPDLVVVSIDVLPGSEATTEDELTVGVEVGNAGDRSVERSIVVCAYVDRAQAPGLDEDAEASARVRDDLPAGSAQRVEIDLGGLSAGNHTLWISIDCGDSVAESDETNNVAGPFEISVVETEEEA